jgi:hemerythrin
MPLLTWNERMSVGVATLDQDHQKLVSMLNDLHDQIYAGHGVESVGKTLDGLIAYTAGHFANEERFFAQTNYPAAAAHHKEHADLTQQVLAVRHKYMEGATEALSMEVLSFLKDWLLHHIQGSDKKYSSHLNANGIH